jgi:WhiB family redox-sensing transcriptional regulator
MKTPEQIERDRARWRRAKANQRARKNGQQVTAQTAPPRRRPVTPVLRVDADWRTRAACRGADPRVFDAETAADAEEAKKVCRRCPVRSDCLAFALRVGAECGVWGGVDLAETAAVAS